MRRSEDGARGKPGAAGVGRVVERWSASQGTSSGVVTYVPCGAGMASTIGGTIQGQPITTKLRAVRWSIRQTVGAGAGLIRYELYSDPSTATGVFFTANATSAYQRGSVAGTFDFDPALGHELILKNNVSSGTVSTPPNRLGIAIEFEEVL